MKYKYFIILLISCLFTGLKSAAVKVENAFQVLSPFGNLTLGIYDRTSYQLEDEQNLESMKSVKIPFKENLAFKVTSSAGSESNFIYPKSGNLYVIGKEKAGCKGASYPSGDFCYAELNIADQMKIIDEKIAKMI